MADTLPSLALLRTFEAAARHQSFRKAAEELHVTPSAVSQQIRTLEDQLGVALFARQPRSLRLTAEGRRLVPGLSRGLDQFAAALAELRAPVPTGPLTVSTSVSFALHWLLPRLPRFRARWPNLVLTILADDRLVDLRAGGADVAIRFGKGHYPGLRSDLILPDRVYAACSPALLAGEDRFRDPRALAHLPLIDDVEVQEGEPWMGWAPWLRELGLAEEALAGRLGVGGAALAIQAALAGLGVALVRHTLAGDLVATGRLVRLPLVARPTDYAYHLVCPGGRAELPGIAALRSWLREEAADPAATSRFVVFPPQNQSVGD
jgi:LysR family glycine cleavage system transcriptional activator